MFLFFIHSFNYFVLAIFEELAKVESSPEKSEFFSVLRKTYRTPTSLWTPSTAKELHSFSISWCTGISFLFLFLFFSFPFLPFLFSCSSFPLFPFYLFPLFPSLCFLLSFAFLTFSYRKGRVSICR